ncbi:MAG: hypothetical protein JWP03_444 [Phycisphaerales bacterium]|nr:hypothetical protein [Phycisphaerales bacterium]
MKHIQWGVLREGDAGETGGGREAVGNAKNANVVRAGRSGRPIITAIFNKLERDDSEPIGMKHAQMTWKQWVMANVAL